jgi:hypothetical protein
MYNMFLTSSVAYSFSSLESLLIPYFVIVSLHLITRDHMDFRCPLFEAKKHESIQAELLTLCC